VPFFDGNAKKHKNIFVSLYYRDIERERHCIVLLMVLAITPMVVAIFLLPEMIKNIKNACGNGKNVVSLHSQTVALR
jgi:hypothetical protein